MLFHPLNPGGIYEVKNGKNWIPETESGNVHRPMIGNCLHSVGIAPPPWRPGCDSGVVFEP